MYSMTERQLVIWLADEFHDWIDGDDCVIDYTTRDNSITVEFESGSKFNIQINQV